MDGSPDPSAHQCRRRTGRGGEPGRAAYGRFPHPAGASRRRSGCASPRAPHRRSAGQDPGQRSREQRLPRARRPAEKDVVSDGGGDLEGALCTFLLPDGRQVERRRRLGREEPLGVGGNGKAGLSANDGRRRSQVVDREHR